MYLCIYISLNKTIQKKKKKCPIHSLCIHALITSFQTQSMTSQCMCSLPLTYLKIPGIPNSRSGRRTTHSSMVYRHSWYSKRVFPSTILMVEILEIIRRRDLTGSREVSTNKAGMIQVPVLIRHSRIWLAGTNLT